MADPLLLLPYTALSFSIIARMIFLYLLYTKRSTNVYSLAFSYLSILSSSLWIPYGIIVQDTPILVRSGVEIVLLSGSVVYITYNRCHAPLQIPVELVGQTVTKENHVDENAGCRQNGPIFRNGSPLPESV